MTTDIKTLEENGIDAVLQAKNADEFVNKFGQMICGICSQMAFLPTAISYRQPDSLSADQENTLLMGQHDLFRCYKNYYLNHAAENVGLAPDTAMLDNIKDKLYQREACRVLRQSRSFSARWHARKIARKNNITLSAKQLYSAISALFVRYGFGTPEDLAHKLASREW